MIPQRSERPDKAALPPVRRELVEFAEWLEAETWRAHALPESAVAPALMRLMDQAGLRFAAWKARYSTMETQP